MAVKIFRTDSGFYAVMVWDDSRKHPRLTGGKSPVRFQARGFSENQDRLKSRHHERRNKMGTVYMELDCNYFNEWSYIVGDVMKDGSFRSFYIGTSLEDPVRIQAAYEQAARHYNTLVPDDECIPLF